MTYRLKHLVRLQYGDALAADAREPGDVLVFGSNGPVGTHSKRNTRVPSIIVGRKGSYGKVTWAPDGGFCIDTAYYVDERWCRCDLRYGYYLLQSLGLDDLSRDSAVPGLDRFDAHNRVVPHNSLCDQRLIANFLDQETARIDHLLERKQNMIDILLSKQETVRDTVVCKGLDRDKPFKKSGVDWFGDVPAHWTVCRFNRLVGSKVDYRGRTPEKVDDGVFLVTARNIRSGKIDYVRSQEFTTAEDWEKLSARGKPELGDIVLTTEAPLGQIAQVDRTDVAFAQRVIKFRANKDLVSNDFLAEFMMSASFQRSLQLYASGSTAAGIKSERMAHLFGLVPPSEEQLRIVKFVRDEIERLNAVIAPILASIDRLREFRAAVITAAVTGQIDVANWHKGGQADHRLEQIEEAMTA